MSFKALADEWGCQVMLCLSDPRGPTTEAECIPPIEKLWQHLAQGGAFPTCELVGNIPVDISDSETYLQQEHNFE